MPSVTGWGSISGRFLRPRRGWLGRSGSEAFLAHGGLRNERAGFFAPRRLFHRVRRDGGRAGSFFGLADLEDVA